MIREDVGQETTRTEDRYTQKEKEVRTRLNKETRLFLHGI